MVCVECGFYVAFMFISKIQFTRHNLLKCSANIVWLRLSFLMNSVFTKVLWPGEFYLRETKFEGIIWSLFFTISMYNNIKCYGVSGIAKKFYSTNLYDIWCMLWGNHFLDMVLDLISDNIIYSYGNILWYVGHGYTKKQALHLTVQFAWVCQFLFPSFFFFPVSSATWHNFRCDWMSDDWVLFHTHTHARTYAYGVSNLSG